jgi:hypothetical protein
MASPFDEVMEDYFVPDALMEIATAGSCMLLQGEALGPRVRYQYFPRLGLYRPDQHLSMRALLCQFPRLVDTSNPLRIAHKQKPHEGSLEWLSNGVAKLLSLSPDSTGLEGVEYLCKELKEQREADAEELSAQLKAGQVHTKILPVSIVPNEKDENLFTLHAMQILQAGNVEEHYGFLIETETKNEEGLPRISGLETSQFLESEIPKPRPANIQRYAIPPLLGLGKEEDVKEVMDDKYQRSAQSPRTLMKSITGLQIYRLPH